MKIQTNALAEKVYNALKQEIFDFYLLPHDHFTESEIADRFQVSRTPVRDALYRLEREGYLQVGFRKGWAVKPIDFDKLDDFYELRIILEKSAVENLCARQMLPLALQQLQEIWGVPVSEQKTDMQEVSVLDEAFHCGLIAAVGNQEMLRMYQGISERIRIVRRLDFLKQKRIDLTYSEHAAILSCIAAHDAPGAISKLQTHIQQSKAEVRQISVFMLEEARRHAQRKKETSAQQ